VLQLLPLSRIHPKGSLVKPANSLGVMLLAQANPQGSVWPLLERDLHPLARS
jgi:hypothetical protein